MALSPYHEAGRIARCQPSRPRGALGYRWSRDDWLECHGNPEICRISDTEFQLRGLGIQNGYWVAIHTTRGIPLLCLRYMPRVRKNEEAIEGIRCYPVRWPGEIPAVSGCPLRRDIGSVGDN